MDDTLLSTLRHKQALSAVYCVYSISLTEWIKTFHLSYHFFTVEYLNIRELALWPTKSTLKQRAAINSEHWEDL